MKFSVRLRFIYGSLRWTGTIWRSEPVHLGEPVRTCIIHDFIWDRVFKSGLTKFCGRQPLKNLKGYGLLKQTISLDGPSNFLKAVFRKIYLVHSSMLCLIYRGVYNLPRQVKELSDFWYSLHVNQYLSYNRLGFSFSSKLDWSLNLIYKGCFLWNCS